MALPASQPADSRKVRMVARIRSLVWTTLLAGTLAALLAAGLLLCLATNIGTAAAQSGAQPPVRDCASSGPAGGSYTVTICLALPPVGAALSGVFPITATAAVSGRNSGPANIDFFLDGKYILGDYATPYHLSAAFALLCRWIIPLGSAGAYERRVYNCARRDRDYAAKWHHHTANQYRNRSHPGSGGMGRARAASRWLR